MVGSLTGAVSSQRVTEEYEGYLRLIDGVSPRTKLLIEAPVNGGRNYNGPKVAKFLVG